MQNYFTKDGKIFIKLYKNIENQIFYWETWNTDSMNATIHWGQLGELGKKIEKKTTTNDELKNILNTLTEQKINEGFAEIPEEDFFTLSITFKLGTWGATKDLERREELRNILTTHLGWTGNGNCDDGDIGGGEMTLYADVIDPQIAIKTITKRFIVREVKEDYYFSIMKGEDIISEHILPIK